ncbi:hypothetical protein [Aeoliella mucimassa]|uniref:Transmembrane protein n=1 Tax=Aeoliella mucimassa TaxID=2527972 RepID=A0A518ASL1_9BACT|nr:hypothetical protein [Aeoliella mucimassa]QDU57714.1 hypothetical protein Pan181_39360 [Aeoliella mucimassa]
MKHYLVKLGSIACSGAWIVNLTLWVGLVGWIATRADSLKQLESTRLKALSLVSADGNSLAVYQSWWPTLAIAAAAATGLVMLASVLVGPRRFRSVRSWLLLMVAAAGWLTLGLGTDDLYWQGQQMRASQAVDPLSEFAEQLASHWPEDDGDWDNLGPFLAYPKPAPTSLLLVGTPQLPGTRFTVSAIERTQDGVLRFELAGGEQPAWLEWQPDGGQPGDFKSGLETPYRVDKLAQLTSKWYLVHYNVGR